MSRPAASGLAARPASLAPRRWLPQHRWRPRRRVSRSARRSGRQPRRPRGSRPPRCRGSQLPPDDREALVVDREGEPGARPERRRGGTGRIRRRLGFRVGLDRRETSARQVVDDGEHQLLRESLVASGLRCRDAGDHRRQRRARQLRVQLANSLRARVGRERSELAPRGRFAVCLEDLRIAAEHRQASPEELELPRGVTGDGRSALAPRREWVVDRLVLIVVTEWVGRPAATGARAAARIEGVEAGPGRRCEWVRGVIGRGRRGGRGLEPRQAGGLRAAPVVLPEVTAPMIEPRIGTGWNASEPILVGDVEDANARHETVAVAGFRPPPAPPGTASSASRPSWTRRVIASRSGPGSRSLSHGWTTSRMAACAVATPAPGVVPGSIASRRSSPRAAHSSSMAMICSTWPRICRACRPEIGPIETWSSWLALVGIESADAGWTRTLFSEASAAAVYWRSIEPVSRPESELRNAGSPSFRCGSMSSAVRRSLIEPSSARASFAKSSASAIGSPWKLPPEITWPLPVARADSSATWPSG